MTITQQQAIEALERVYYATHASFIDRNLVRQYIEQSTAQPQAVVPAAQPSAQAERAPVQAVQAGEYPPLPMDALDALARMIKRGEPGSVPGSIVEVARLMRAYVDADRASSGATPADVRMLTEVERDVLAERQRQISAEGWTPEHDDEHDAWSMAVAAACYSLWDRPATQATTGRLPNLWQWTGWDQSWFKPKDPRRNLVRAAALLLAEIERLDRAGKRIPADGVIGGV